MDFNPNFLAGLRALEQLAFDDQHPPQEKADSTEPSPESDLPESPESSSTVKLVPTIVVPIQRAVLARGGLVSLASHGIAASLRLPPGTSSGHRLRLPDSNNTRVIFIAI